MKNSSNSGINVKELALWAGIAVVTAAAFYISYYVHISSPVKIIIWILWVIITAVLGFFTSKGKQIFKFANEAKIELLKVVWPTRPETIQTTSIVMVMVTITGFILWSVDSVMMWLIAKITHLG